MDSDQAGNYFLKPFAVEMKANISIFPLLKKKIKQMRACVSVKFVVLLFFSQSCFVVVHTFNFKKKVSLLCPCSW